MEIKTKCPMCEKAFARNFGKDTYLQAKEILWVDLREHIAAVHFKTSTRKTKSRKEK